MGAPEPLGADCAGQTFHAERGNEIQETIGEEETTMNEIPILSISLGPRDLVGRRARGIVGHRPNRRRADRAPAHAQPGLLPGPRRTHLGGRRALRGDGPSPQPEPWPLGSPAQKTGWQAAFMDHIVAPVMCLIADPEAAETGQLLAGTDGGGILRSADGGLTWQSSNFGLHNQSILALAWTAAPPAQAWPRWSVVFACTEEGLYRSPNAGRGWKRADCPPNFYQCIAPAPDFHHSRLVLAGSEEAGLFRSTDGGRSFQPVAGTPTQVNAIVAVPGGWVLSGGEAALAIRRRRELAAHPRQPRRADPVRPRRYPAGGHRHWDSAQGAAHMELTWAINQLNQNGERIRSLVADVSAGASPTQTRRRCLVDPRSGLPSFG